MRALLGSVAFTVGGFLAIGATFVPCNYPGADRRVLLAGGGVALLLIAAGLFLLLGQRGAAPRWSLIVMASLFGGMAGFIVGASKTFKYCGIEGRGQTYKLTVQVFEKVLDEETGPAVQSKHGNAIGPSEELEGKMACWEFGIDAGFVAVGALLGGLLGVAIRQLTRPQAPGATSDT
jgi:hypothetical protein